VNDIRICIIGPSINMGGIERASVTIANNFSHQNLVVAFIAIFKQAHFYNLHKDIVFIEPASLNSERLNIVKSLFWLRKKIKEVEPDVVLVFNFFYGALVLLSTFKTGVPIYISDRASPFYSWPKYVSYFNKIVFKFLTPTGLIAQTQKAADFKAMLFGHRTFIKVIPNPLREVILFPEVERRKQILAVGRLNDKLKGFDRLVDAFARIENREWILVFAGGDEEGEELKSQAQSNDVSDRIIFLGKVKDIDRVYAEAGIFVIPSRSEGFPNALCEAMAAGLPCISFDFCAGPREIINDGYDGILVENNNIELLARTIDLLIKDETERMRLGQHAMEIRERLNEHKIGQIYLDFIIGGDYQRGKQ